MRDSQHARVIGIVGLLALACLAVWGLFPRADTEVAGTPAPAPISAPTAGRVAAAPPDGAPAPDEPAGAAELVVVEGDEPPIPSTKRCTLIAGWAQRNVPHYTILDNIRDRAMRFTEDDLACLTAAQDMPPIVLRFAEMRQRRDQE